MVWLKIIMFVLAVGLFYNLSFGNGMIALIEFVLFLIVVRIYKKKRGAEGG